MFNFLPSPQPKTELQEMGGVVKLTRCIALPSQGREFSIVALNISALEGSTNSFTIHFSVSSFVQCR